MGIGEWRGGNEGFGRPNDETPLIKNNRWSAKEDTI